MRVTKLCSMPAATATAPVKATLKVVLSVVAPSPNCPLELLPAAHTVPFWWRTSVCFQHDAKSAAVALVVVLVVAVTVVVEVVLVVVVEVVVVVVVVVAVIAPLREDWVSGVLASWTVNHAVSLYLLYEGF